MPSNSLFISYSRRDMTPVDWLERLNLHLAPLRRRGIVDTWDDGRLRPGQQWRSEIRAAIERATAAILLVGPGFLASEFIATDELPMLLAAASTRGLRVYPLLIGYCQYTMSALEGYQAFNKPEAPLEALSPPEQNKLLYELSAAVGMEMLEEAPQVRAEQVPSSPSGWQSERAAEYTRTDGFMLVHVYRPSLEPGQAFEVFIFLVRHRTGSEGPPQRDFSEILTAEFFFGASWGNEIFTIPNSGGLLGVRTHAWGTFLATCRLTFTDSARPPIVLHRYIDFEMATAEPNFGVQLTPRRRR